MTDIKKEIADNDPIPEDYILNIDLMKSRSREANSKNNGQKISGNKINGKITPNYKQNGHSKGSSNINQIIIIALMISTFIGFGVGLVVIFSHLNEEDGREAITTDFFHQAYNYQSTFEEKCRMGTINAVKRCFNQSDYFLETIRQRKCEYLENVGHCVLEREKIDAKNNCSNWRDMLELIKPTDTVFSIADAFLQIDIRKCPFYKITATTEVKPKVERYEDTNQNKPFLHTFDA